MSALAETQTPESLESFNAGSTKRKRTTEEEYPFLSENVYYNKKRKLATDNEQKELFQRGRYRFDQLGILRTKPGSAFVLSSFTRSSVIKMEMSFR